ncbi:MAG: cysteine desulfurase [Oscillospiraceae bacterium]|nr:cysteine desulfurase [Oscillospiraceae bacterium]
MAFYLDHAATTKPCEQAIEAITACLREHYGNPSSLHRVGLDAQLAMDGARAVVAGAIGAQPESILFTSGATESSNLALRGAASAYGRHRPHIVTSAVEHASVRETITALEAQGFSITRILPDENGVFHAADFLDAVTDKTCLISMMLVENETGRILPVAETFRAVKRRYPHVITHCDIVQGFLKLPVKASALHADLMSMSAHKIHGPKGVGALYTAKGIRLIPVTTGGKQERGLRPGTESVPLICGFGAAVQYMQPTIDARFAQTQDLRRKLLAALSSMDGITLNSEPEGSPYIVNFSVHGIRSEIMLHYLEQREIYVSSGSACSKGARSGVLSAYRIPEKQADCAIRCSFSEETTPEAIEALLCGIREGQAQLIHQNMH